MHFGYITILFTLNDPLYLSSQKISGGQQEEGHAVVPYVQGGHHQNYLLHHYQNASSQDRHGGTVPHYSLGKG